MAKRQADSEAKIDEPTIASDGSGTQPQTTPLPGAAQERVGGTIGPYKLLDELGEGGMGTVFLAEQDHPVRRRVALKIIKAGLDTAQVIARFEAERQALALMDHPHIARVVDAGTTASGRPYFVMELVQGVPITGYCDQRRLPLRERLAIFLPICRAVQHAHQKGIIHRDLKPSNILVTMRDDQPVPKIIDFGIAKATTHRLTERTLYTQYGQLVGTPDYMSPEQAGLGGLDVDTRSDVYSLGAVLYELLCGDTPLGRERIKSLDFVTMLNVIYEHEPLRPSKRVAEYGDKAADIARRRDSEPAKLVQQLRGELDWIAVKALEKERTRRYESPSALAADIERHLNNQPVEASPHSATYRLQKFARRNRAPLAAAAAIALVLVGGIIVSSLQAYRARQAEADMAAEREAALLAKGEAEAARTLAESRRRDAEKATKSAEAQQKLAEAQRKLADDRGAELKAALAKAEQHINETAAIRLAIESNKVRQESPQRSLLLATEAFEAARRTTGPILPDADQSLRDALASIGGRPLGTPHTAMGSFLIDPTGRWLFGNAQSPGEASVRRWDLTAKDPAANSIAIGGPQFQHVTRAISPDGHWLATSNTINNLSVIHLWDLRSENLDKSNHESKVPAFEEVSFSADGRWLIARSNEGAILWDMTAQTPFGSESSTLLAGGNIRLAKVAISPQGRFAVSADRSGSPTLWELGPTPKRRPLVGEDPEKWRNSEFSSDGRWVAASTDGPNPDLKVWDLNAEDPLQASRAIPLSKQEFYRKVLYGFIRGGQYFAVAQQGTISLWDLTADASQMPRATLTLPETSVASTANLIDRLESDRAGRLLLAVTLDGTIYRWDLSASEPQPTRSLLGQHPGASGIGFTFSPSGRWLVTTRQNDHARLWDLWGQNPAAIGMTLRGHDAGATQAIMGGAAGLALRPAAGFGGLPQPATSDRWLITGDANGSPRLWDLAAPDPARADVRDGVWKVQGLDAAVRPDGNWVVIASPLRFHVINPDATPAVTASVQIPRAGAAEKWPSEDLQISADGRWYAVRQGNEIAIWDLLRPELQAPPSDNGAEESLSGLKQLVTSKTGMTARPDAVVRGADASNAFAISPDGRWVLTTSDTSVEPKLWRREGGTDAMPLGLGGTLGKRRPLRFSPDGRWLAGVGSVGVLFLSRPVVAIWDLKGDQPRKLPPLNFPQEPVGDVAIAFSGDGKWLAAANRGVMISELGEQGPTKESRMYLDNVPSTLQRVAISRDGRWVAAAARELIFLVDRKAGANGSAVLLRGHEQPLDALAFSPDDRWLISSGADGDVRLWNLLADQPQTAMIVLAPGDTVREGGISRIRFSPDGKRLAHCSGHRGQVQIWQLDAADLLDDARRLAARELSNAELQQYRLDGVAEVLRGRLTRAAAEVARKLEANPQNVGLRRRQVNLLACAGDFSAAIDAMRLLISLDPKEHFSQYQFLSLLAQAGRKEEFLRASESMARQFADETSRPEIHERVAKGALFWSDSGADWKKVAPLADNQLEQSLRVAWIQPWALATKSLAEYRVGNYDSSLKWAERSLAVFATQPGYYGVVPANQVKAMALARLGRFEEAQDALAIARVEHDRADRPYAGTPFANENWHDLYMGDIMFREVEAVMRARPDTDEQTAATKP